MKLTSSQFEAIADALAESIARRAKVSVEYAREFAVYSTGFAASLLDDPDPKGLERFQAQARAVAETITEINEQSIPGLLDSVEDYLRITLAVLRAAAIAA